MQSMAMPTSSSFSPAVAGARLGCCRQPGGGEDGAPAPEFESVICLQREKGSASQAAPISRCSCEAR